MNKTDNGRGHNAEKKQSDKRNHSIEKNMMKQYKRK